VILLKIEYWHIDAFSHAKNRKLMLVLVEFAGRCISAGGSIRRWQCGTDIYSQRNRVGLHEEAQESLNCLWLMEDECSSVHAFLALCQDLAFVCTRWLHARPLSRNVQTVLQMHRLASASLNWCYLVNRRSANPAWCCVSSKDSFTNIKKVRLEVCVPVTDSSIFTGHICARAVNS